MTCNSQLELGIRVRNLTDNIIQRDERHYEALCIVLYHQGTRTVLVLFSLQIGQYCSFYL